MRESFLSEAQPLPLLVTPNGEGPVGDPVALVAWTRANLQWLGDKLRQYGGILFRGFAFDSPQVFEQFVAAISPRFMEYTRGATPRQHVQGQVYTSTEAPPSVPIPLHCEMSYMERFPDKIYFYCQVAPKQGGQTPVADMQQVYNHLDPSVRQRFEEKGLQFIQNVPERRRWLTPKTWQTMFETGDRAVVETTCTDQHLTFRWKPDGTLQIINQRPAVITHPQTGTKIWFNSAHNFHDSWSWEFYHLKRWGLATLLKFREQCHKRTLHVKDYPNHCIFGDGSDIPPEDIEHIRSVLWQHAVLFDWQQGDVLMLDNLRIAHGRMPFRGPRKVLVALTGSMQ
jgi:alpha-ketoglutarate-dependent taurine dioxygenase